jgi:hypothetical protein
MNPMISEPATKLVNRELQMFKRYLVDAFNVIWSGEENMNPFSNYCFPCLLDSWHCETSN